MNELTFYSTEFRPDTLDPAQFKNDLNLIVEKFNARFPNSKRFEAFKIWPDVADLADRYDEKATSTALGYDSGNDSNPYAPVFIDIFVWLDERDDLWSFSSTVFGYYDLNTGERVELKTMHRTLHRHTQNTQWYPLIKDGSVSFPTMPELRLGIDQDVEIYFVRPVSVFIGVLQHAWISPYAKNNSLYGVKKGVSGSKPTVIATKQHIPVLTNDGTTNPGNLSAYMVEINEDFKIYR